MKLVLILIITGAYSVSCGFDDEPSQCVDKPRECHIQCELYVCKMRAIEMRLSAVRSLAYLHNVPPAEATVLLDNLLRHTTLVKTGSRFEFAVGVHNK